MYWNSQSCLYKTMLKSDWLLNTQSRVLRVDWFILENNEKAILIINMPFLAIGVSMPTSWQVPSFLLVSGGMHSGGMTQKNEGPLFVCNSAIPCVHEEKTIPLHSQLELGLELGLGSNGLTRKLEARVFLMLSLRHTDMGSIPSTVSLSQVIIF